MRKFSYRFAGGLMVLVALLTWVVSILGVVYVWQNVPGVIGTLDNEAANVSQILLPKAR